jgi:hypothetical protein
VSAAASFLRATSLLTLRFFLRRGKSKTLARSVTIPRVPLEFFSTLAMRVKEEDGKRSKQTYQVAFSLVP